MPIKLAILDKVRKYPFRIFLRKYRSRYGIGMLALVAVDLINVVLPLLIKEAVDAIPSKNVRRLLLAGFLYLALMFLQSFGRYLWRVYLIGTSHRIANDLRLRLYGHLQRLPLEHYQRVRTGDLMSRATNDIESVRMAVGPGILVTADAILMFLLIVPVMLYFSVKLSLLAFAFYPIVPWLTARLGNRIDTLFESLQARMSRLSAHVQESFVAVRLIKSLVLETKVSERFRNLSLQYRSEGLKLARCEAAFSPMLGLLTNLGTFLILCLGGIDVMKGIITVGTFIAFQRFVVQLSWPMEAIGWAVTMNQEGTAAYRRLEQVWHAPAVESIRVSDYVSQVSSELLELRNLHHRTESDNGEPGFSLELDGLKIHPGQRVGLVGPVGAGKSTLFNLILRLYEPPERTIFYHGRDVASIPLSDLRRAIASVEQQVFLFSEDIRANVLMGVEGRASSTEIERAIDTACILEEILELDRGFDTALGERGVNLSGGQKQRLALARALARKPDLLLLDDAFSAVDVAVEERIIEKLLAHYPGLSLCFASHRLSVMPRMDEIWLLSGGRIIASGSHSLLIEQNALYQALWEKSERQRETELLGGSWLEGESPPL